MLIDMHFYGIYTLARAAGFTPDDAGIIAYASQYVDDAVKDSHFPSNAAPAIRFAMTAHKALDYRNAMPVEQWNVWIPFHFLPGNQPDDGSFEERMTCAKDSPVSRSVLDFAFEHANEAYGLHMAGIALHAYADTFSHWGFTGLKNARNRVISRSICIGGRSLPLLHQVKASLRSARAALLGGFCEVLPVGHGAVECLPDRPYFNKWSFRRGGGQVVFRENTADFLEGCEKILDFLTRLANVGGRTLLPATPWASMAPKVRSVLEYEAPREKRGQAWLGLFSDGTINPPKSQDSKTSYEKEAWCKQIDEASGQNLSQTNAALFMRAAWMHRQFVLHDLLPRLGLLAF